MGHSGLRLLAVFTVATGVLAGVILSPAASGAMTTEFVPGRLSDELRITGDGNPNNIVVGCDEQREVVVNGSAPSSGPVSCDRVEKVLVNAESGEDVVDLRGVTVEFGSSSSDARIYTQAFLGPGDDYLVGSALPDEVFAWDGNDRMKGNLGADLLYGQRGRDSLFGGPGGDSLYGGFGRDRLLGQGGDDVLVGGPGSDGLFGGPGDNSTVK